MIKFNNNKLLHKKQSQKLFQKNQKLFNKKKFHNNKSINNNKFRKKSR